MKKHPEAIAWEKWLESDEGKSCSDPMTTDPRPEFRHYLENRLSLAFRAGAAYAENQAKEDLTKATP